jgi:hypothetical protein
MKTVAMIRCMAGPFWACVVAFGCASNTAPISPTGSVAREAGASEDAALGEDAPLDEAPSNTDLSGDEAPLGAEPCIDGTGATDCCPMGAKGNGVCEYPGLHCWTRCAFSSADAPQGMRAALGCSSGTWVAGHGLFPCQREAGP